MTKAKLAFLSSGFKEEWLLMEFGYSTLVEYDKMQLETYSKSSYMLSRHIQVWFRLSRLFTWGNTRETERAALASNVAPQCSYSMKKSWEETSFLFNLTVIKIHIHRKSLFRSSLKYILCIFNRFSRPKLKSRLLFFFSAILRFLSAIWWERPICVWN